MAEPSVVPPPPEAPPRFVELVGRVAVAFNVTAEELLDKSHFKSRAAARHVVMWLIRKTWSPQPSFPEIGMMFKRDHTSVMHGVDRINKEIASKSDVGQIALRFAEPPTLRLVSNEPVEAPVAAAE